MRDVLMTGDEVAGKFGVHRKTVYRWGVTGRLACVRTPTGRCRYPRAEVDRLYAQLGGGAG